MTDDFAKVLDTMTAAATEPEDYAGEDGLLYCGKCRTPKEAFFPADKAALFGRDRHPAECDCQRAQRMEREAAEQRRKHLDSIADDTSAIKDSVDITDEDLKYLRDIAEQEAVNRFTTAEIKLDMTTNNNVSSDADLDGIVDGMTTKVLQALETVREGV